MIERKLFFDHYNNEYLLEKDKEHITLYQVCGTFQVIRYQAELSQKHTFKDYVEIINRLQYSIELYNLTEWII